MWLLTFGSCLIQQRSVASEKLLYTAFNAGLIAFGQFNRFSLDALRKETSSG